MKFLVVDVGESRVKILATGQEALREFASGPSLTAEEIVSGVLDAAGGWKFDLVSIGYPGPVLRGKPASETASTSGRGGSGSISRPRSGVSSNSSTTWRCKPWGATSERDAPGLPGGRYREFAPRRVPPLGEGRRTEGVRSPSHQRQLKDIRTSGRAISLHRAKQQEHEHDGNLQGQTEGPPGNRLRDDGVSFREAGGVLVQGGPIRRSHARQPAGDRRGGEHARVLARQRPLRGRPHGGDADAGHRVQAGLEDDGRSGRNSRWTRPTARSRSTTTRASPPSSSRAASASPPSGASSSRPPTTSSPTRSSSSTRIEGPRTRRSWTIWRRPRRRIRTSRSSAR